jgi:BASS family bile acid:Na+ symporter
MAGVTGLLFVMVIVLALAANWESFMANIGVLGPALITVAVVLLALGVLSAWAAGLTAREVTTVAIESGIQNGTLGVAVGGIVAEVSTGLPVLTLPFAFYSVTARTEARHFVRAASCFTARQAVSPAARCAIGTPIRYW